MKFHDVSNVHDSLTHYVNSLLGFAEGSLNEYPLASKARTCNTFKYKVALWFWQNQDAWDFDDSGHTDFPIASTTLVDNQEDYGLPTSALIVKEVEILDSGGIYKKLRAIDEKEVKGSLTEYKKEKGVPDEYRIFSNSLFLKSPPDTTMVTAAAGLKLLFLRAINEFTASTTTTEIGMGEPADRAVAIGVALEFAQKRGMEVATELEMMLYGGVRRGVKIDGLKDQITELVSRRTEEITTKIRPTYPSKDRMRYQ